MGEENYLFRGRYMPFTPELDGVFKSGREDRRGRRKRYIKNKGKRKFGF